MTRDDSELSEPVESCEPSPRPPRRPRYAGTHPRRFQEKYKEHQPDRYADDVAHIEAQGRTAAGTHRPIMTTEVLGTLRPQPGDVAVDCTLGYGGHAQLILKAILPGGRLFGVDADPVELAKTTARLQALGDPSSVETRRLNFAGVTAWLAERGEQGADVAFADLGVSSMQLDDPNRGFSYKLDGPLDMRMNPARGEPASAWLARLSADRLAKLFDEYADLPDAQRLATHLAGQQRMAAISTTHGLASAVREACAGRANDDVELTVRRVFQALRIAVNDELGALDALLRQLPQMLKPGGRVAILTFHSGEDRRVKLGFKAGREQGVYSAVSDEVIRPSAVEVHANPRASSAKLRWAVRAS